MDYHFFIINSLRTGIRYLHQTC